MSTYHHSLAIRERLCHGCTHCMKKCPTAAIRIEKGRAQVDSAKCINCGQCMQACANNAIGVEQSPFEMLFSFKQRVAIVPAVFFSQFEEEITNKQICMALYDIGFTHLYFAEFGIDILDVLGVTEPEDVPKPVISNYCPAVKHLIHTRYPGLVQHLSRLRAPSQLTAILARAEVDLLSGSPEDTGVFLITPCPAKIAELKTEESDGIITGLFDGVLNLDTVYNMVRNSLTKNRRRFAAALEDTILPPMTARACKWSLIAGEKPTDTLRRLAIDEIHQVIDFLEYIEEEDDLTIDFLELKSCAEGCVGGILCTRNKFLAKERLTHLVTQFPETLDDATRARILAHADLLRENVYEQEPETDESIKLDEDLEVAIHKMEKARRIVAALPGIDCGLCGAPTCAELARDIAQSSASIRQCAVLRLKDPKELNTLARIWGEKISTES
ncbi:MAG: 4Fe-4S binding protein [Spirochaetales bacterium]|nr:4Fe-4S binding protein [Spirochaetales bacterium]